MSNPLTGSSKIFILLSAVLAGFALVACGVSAEKLPEGYWNEKETQKILDKTLTIRLDPDISHLTEPERETIRLLLDVGRVLHSIYEESRHYQSAAAYEDLLALDKEMSHSKATRNLLDLFRLNKGPVGRKLDGDVEPFLPVDARPPGKNVYPWGIEKEEVEAFLAEHPDARKRILHPRTIVRRTTPENLQRDIDVWEKYSGTLATLHPDIARNLYVLRSQGAVEEDLPMFYSVPYSVAYADQIMWVYDLLTTAAGIIEETDIDFSRYLRHRAVDLLRDDYEAGDAAWITGRFGNLNAQIGSYETYDDGLYGVKTFFSLSLLVKDRVMSSSLNTVVKWLQEFEDNLPYEPHKAVRTDIPVGVYNVIADFGQARGTNTATILPNESYITRKYGRTILIRRNILENPQLFDVRRDAFNAAVAEEFHEDYAPDGDFFRTLFHEIGHYVGPDLDKNGRSLDIALEEDSSILEELKSDLVSLFVSKQLNKKQYYNMKRLRAVQAAGIRRVLRKNEPKKSQAYATMQLMQMNYYLEKGLLEYDRKTKKLHIRYDQYHPAVESMLREVLALQYDGDKAAADAFIERYSTWEGNLHERIAGAMKKAEKYRYGLVRYAALGE